MRIGVPRELKPLEGRVGLIPAACAELVRAGHEVFVEKDGGVKSGYGDDQFTAIGVKILDSAEEVYEVAEMVVKVKEPIAEDLNSAAPSRHTVAVME